MTKNRLITIISCMIAISIIAISGTIYYQNQKLSSDETQTKEVKSNENQKPVATITNNPEINLVEIEPVKTIETTITAPTPKTTIKSVPSTKPDNKKTENKANTITETPKQTCHENSFNQKFTCLLNEYRKTKGKSALSLDTTLTVIAQNHTSWMNTTGTFSHTGENNTTPFQRCENSNTSCSAENIAQGFTSPEKLLSQWQNSPPHNTNLLGPYTLLGLGTINAYATAVFK